MAAIITTRSEVPTPFHSSSYSPSASPRARPSTDLEQRDRQSSTTSSSGQKSYRQLSAGAIPKEGEKDQEQLYRSGSPSYERSASTHSTAGRRPLEPSSAANMSAKEAPKREQVSRGRRTASDQEMDYTSANIKSGRGDVLAQQQSSYQAQQQSMGYFPSPQQPWTAPQRSGSPSGSQHGGSPMYFPQYPQPGQLPPQIQALSPSAQQAYVQAMAVHQFQNNQAAWASAYQGMMMASQQGGNVAAYAQQMQSGMPRSASNHSVNGDQYQRHPQQQKEQPRSISASSSNASVAASSGFHPYRRQPSNKNIAKDRDQEVERLREPNSSSSSTREPANYPEADEMQRPNVSISQPEAQTSRPSLDDSIRGRIRRGNSASFDSGPVSAKVTSSRKPVPSIPNDSTFEELRPQGASNQMRFNNSNGVDPSFEHSTPRKNMHKRQNSSTSSVGEVIKPTLMSANSLSSIGTVTPSVNQNDGLNPSAKEWKPSTLSHGLSAEGSRQAPRSVSDSAKKEVEKKEKGGLRGRLQKAMKRDTEPIEIQPKTPVRQAHPVMTASTSAPATLHQANDSIASTSTTTHSTDPPVTPPQPTPASLGNRRPSNSSFAPSFVEPLDGGRGKPKRSLFNMRNASTDNISISSTVSSASMMIRKMGALGKIARRNSLAGITKIFKDKGAEDGDIVEEPKDKKDKKKFRFGTKSQPSASITDLATAQAVEQDRVLDGLTPAAQLARQHTLRSKTEDKERKSPASAQERSNSGLSPNDAVAGRRSNDHDDSDDDPSYTETEDVTLRMDGLQVGDESRRSYENSREWEENALHWGQGYVDRHAIPAKGILKAISSYSGETDLPNPGAPWTRARANSTDTSSHPSEPGPLARITDQSHIDGRSPHEAADPFSPSFDPFETATDKSQASDRLNLYANASLNSSAPMLSLNNPFARTQRSATSPMPRMRLKWAPECAIYHTFHATEYDRRSEPATCNRLTPALAQEIKDELNGFKMEEMAVHPQSRMHTHFFV